MDGNLPTPPTPLELDVNADGTLTISDLLAWLREVYFLPGDWLIWLAMSRAPGVARFFEISASDYGGLCSLALSGFLWFVAFIAVLLTYHSVRWVDGALTLRLRMGYAFLLRRLRLVIQLSKQRLSQRSFRLRTPSVDMSQELELDELELRALKAHEDIHAPYALGVSEVANALGESRRRTRTILEKLKGLGLLQRSAGTSDGEDAYQLSQSGRGLVSFRQLTP